MPQQSGAAGQPAVASPDAQLLKLSELKVRREMLSEQYQEAMQQRGQIGQERMNAQARGEAAMVREYEGVVARLGTRMQEIEASIRKVDAQIDEVMKGPVQEYAVAPTAPADPTAVTVSVPSYPFADLVAQRIEFQRMMVAEGVVLLLFGALLWRFGVARGRRQAVRAEVPRDDTRMQQAIDAIAIEVERLSEGQRFINNLMAGRRPEREALPVQPLPMVEPRDPSWNTPH